MRIGIDASRIAVKRPTGTERYALQVTKHMLAEDPRQRFVLYFNGYPPAEVLEWTENALWRSIPSTRMWTQGRLSLEMLRRPPDALFVPAHVVPLVHPRSTVVTIHDLGYRYFPDTHTARRRVLLDLSTRFSCRAARRIIVPSAATRRDLERHYGVPTERIQVISHGVDADFAPVRDPETLAAVRARYGLQTDYLLYLGTLQPRKNIGRLVEAFLRSRERSGRQVALVLAGQPGWLMNTIDTRIADAESRGAVIRLGYVPRTDLAALFSGALAFVFPSLYEGFGLPVLEAMACGTPVLASSTSSLPEVVDDAGLLVDPRDTDAMREALTRLVREPELRERLSAMGLERARRFTWERCARETLDVIRGAPVL